MTNAEFEAQLTRAQRKAYRWLRDNYVTDEHVEDVDGATTVWLNLHKPIGGARVWPDGVVMLFDDVVDMCGVFSPGETMTTEEVERVVAPREEA